MGVGGSGLHPLEAKAFLLVTDNRRSWLDSPFCVITQHRKFEFGHHTQSKKISNAQELRMQLSQTLSSAIAQIKFQTAQLQLTQKKFCSSALLLFSISENFRKSRMQEKPSTTFLRLILYIFYFSLISFLYFSLLFFKKFRLFCIF